MLLIQALLNKEKINLRTLLQTKFDVLKRSSQQEKYGRSTQVERERT